MVSQNILYSCYVTRNLSNEQFIPEHIFLYQLSGSLTINDANREYKVATGEFCLAKRNHLARYVKEPPVGGEYKTISVSLSQVFLREFSQQFGYTSEGAVTQDAIVKIESNESLEKYISSLTPYFDSKGFEQEEIVLLKTKELVFLLIKLAPELKNILFDFKDPGKIDLEAFMNRNFKFNISMERFSYMSGRSLTTFKRDFEKTFKSPPGRWLLQRRLKEAYYLIHKKGKKASEVYLEVGFEDISHFSRSFKKMFGIVPSKIRETLE
ncbi:MAG: helix-turn-helix transcriptional regulator [Flavobacterium sp.]|nr:helix-turn-helix transcriptional regulator [Flavobacterium sp.]